MFILHFSVDIRKMISYRFIMNERTSFYSMQIKKLSILRVLVIVMIFRIEPLSDETTDMFHIGIVNIDAIRIAFLCITEQ